MSKLFPAIVTSVGGTVAIVVGGGYLLSTQNTKTIRNTFSVAIIDFEKEDKLVKEKLKKLRDVADLPEKSIFKIAQVAEKKTADSGLTEFKKSCTKIYDSNFTKKDSELFNNFKDYCARTIKDKVTKDSWAADGAKWKERFEKLNKNGNIPVSPELQQIASKTSQNGNELKDWCTKVADLVFESDENKDFKDAQVFCGKND